MSRPSVTLQLVHAPRNQKRILVFMKFYFVLNPGRREDEKDMKLIILGKQIFEEELSTVLFWSDINGHRLGRIVRTLTLPLCFEQRF